MEPVEDDISTNKDMGLHDLNIEADDDDVVNPNLGDEGLALILMTVWMIDQGVLKHLTISLVLFLQVLGTVLHFMF